jgi:hypothetical protein
MDRLTVPEAARALGIKEESVRKRISRGKLRADRGEDSRLVVYLDGHATVRDESRDESAPDRTAELIATLREQLQAERTAHAEARRLLAAALERIPPQLEPPSEDGPGPPDPWPLRSTPTDASEGAQMAAEPRERRSWWQRMFSG